MNMMNDDGDDDDNGNDDGEDNDGDPDQLLLQKTTFETMMV